MGGVACDNVAVFSVAPIWVMKSVSDFVSDERHSYAVPPILSVQWGHMAGAYW